MRVVTKVLLILVCWLMVGKCALAKKVEVVGEGCDPNINIAKEKALKNAKKNAVESYVGTLIDSRELVVKGKLMREIIQTMALGKVKLVGTPAILKSYTDPKKGFCCVTLKAKFEIDKEQIINLPNFEIGILLNKKEFKPGDEMEIYLYAKNKCYPYLFSVDSEGKVYRLLPNFIEKEPVLSGKMVFPTEKMKLKGIELRVFPSKKNPDPRQVEELIFICTRKKEDVLLSLFPEAFVQSAKDLKKFYTLNQEKLAEILEQIGMDNYEMKDDVYFVLRK